MPKAIFLREIQTNWKSESHFFKRDTNQLEEKGLIMKVQDYCKAMLAEVTAWKGGRKLIVYRECIHEENT
jgi:hypothetical protein